MNDLSQNQTNQPAAAEQPDDQSQRAWTRGRVRRGERREASWVGGAVLCMVGIFFLAQTLGGTYLNNWWALFILLPAIGAFGASWRICQDAGGHMTYAARASLLGGLLLVCVAGIFLFNLSWSILGPVLLILAGVGMLLNILLPK